MKPGKSGIERIINAFKYSCEGFKAAYKSEEAFRQDILICIILLPIAIFLRVTTAERLLLFSTMILLIMAELMNTAIEYTIDRISHDIHPLSKIAKDIGSCIVFFAFIYMVIVWGTIIIGIFL